MKKSMIATAVVATAGLAASANAGYFTIAGASYNPGTVAVSGSGFTQGQGSITTGGNLLDTVEPQAGSANTITALNATSITNITGALSAFTSDGTTNVLNYFSFTDGGGSAFFGVMLSASSSGYLAGFSFNDDAVTGTYGVLSSGGAGTIDTFTNTWSNNATIAANGTFIAIFGGVGVGGAFDGQVNRGVNETGTMEINYLSWNGSAWNAVGTGTGATSSSLSVATYAVPVPAPALLAGAGLVGAAALRRRMAKKA